MPSMSYTSTQAVAGPIDLNTYTRSMHHYTSAQLGQMRNAIANVAETANGTMRNRENDRVERENNSVRERIDRERAQRVEPEREMSRDAVRVVGGRDFA